MKVESIIRLSSVYDLTDDPSPVSDLGYAVLYHQYDYRVVERISQQAVQLERLAKREFLGLKHLRGAHTLIPEVAKLMYDEARLQKLSEICGTVVEPYPFTRAGSHINYYEANRLPISYHTDGPPFVELIPLLLEGEQEGGATLIFKGNPRVGLARQRASLSMPADSVIAVPHSLERSVIMQGRSLFHAAETLTGGRRITLVLPLRSRQQPWKDSNTLERLLLDDQPEDVVDEWVKDAVVHRLPALRSALTDVG